VIVDVLEYAQPVTKRGLNLLNGPGNDLVSSTALAVSGAHLILFTTGRGTPFGAPVPTVKISSNTALALKKPAWVDFNAGALTESADMAALAEELYNRVREIASGERLTRTEEHGIRGMAIFKTGITL
jgi:altronate hydrolase